PFSPRPARITVLFEAGACAVAVIAIPKNETAINATVASHRLILRRVLAYDLECLKNFIQHLVVNWLSERGEYNKTVLQPSLWRQLLGFIHFLVSDFHFLSLQLHDGDRFPSVLFGLKRMFLDQRMRSQKLANPLAKRARTVSMNDPDARLVRERRIVEEFI